MIDGKPTVVDLFCGCGGFGLGAELAGFHTVAAIDVDETLQSAYKRNFPNTNVVKADLSKINKNDWDTILKDIGNIDGVIGGPPCQGYSRIGKGDISDSRRFLIMDFFRHVNILSPKFFVMENVEGLLDSKNIGQLKKAILSVDKNYTVLEPLIIDSSLYGAPTKRKRVIIVGFDRRKISNINKEIFLYKKTSVNVRDAISDLPNPIQQSNNSEDLGWAKYKSIEELSEYAKSLRALPPENLGDSEAIHRLYKKEISGNFATIHSKAVQERYASIEPGNSDPVSRSKKLSWNGLCPTLRAGTGADKGSYQAVRPLHPDFGRVITVREAARLQGFPDWFCFHPTKWHSFRMIGNSVSPVVSREILTNIFIAMKGFN